MQNGAGVRPNFNCTVCQSQYEGVEDFRKHLESREHEKAYSVRLNNSLVGSYFCNCCHICVKTLLVWKSHIIGTKHMRIACAFSLTYPDFDFDKPAMIKSAGVLDQNWEIPEPLQRSNGRTNSLVKQISFDVVVIGVTDVDYKRPGNYFCKLCHEEFNEGNKSQHLGSSRHRTNVFKRWDMSLYEEAVSMKQIGKSEFTARCESIAKEIFPVEQQVLSPEQKLLYERLMGTSSTLDDRYFAEELAQSRSAARIAAQSSVPPAPVSSRGSGNFHRGSSQERYNQIHAQLNYSGNPNNSRHTDNHYHHRDPYGAPSERRLSGPPPFSDRYGGPGETRQSGPPPFSDQYGGTGEWRNSGAAPTGGPGYGYYENGYKEHQNDVNPENQRHFLQGSQSTYSNNSPEKLFDRNQYGASSEMRNLGPVPLSENGHRERGNPSVDDPEQQRGYPIRNQGSTYPGNPPNILCPPRPPPPRAQPPRPTPPRPAPTTEPSILSEEMEIDSIASEEINASIIHNGRRNSFEASASIEPRPLPPINSPPPPPPPRKRTPAPPSPNTSRKEKRRRPRTPEKHSGDVERQGDVDSTLYFDDEIYSEILQSIDAPNSTTAKDTKTSERKESAIPKSDSPKDFKRDKKVASKRISFSIKVKDPKDNGNKSGEPSELLTENQIAMREKQVMYGKVTDGYQNYKSIIPKKMRHKRDPVTPDSKFSYSKRCWDGLVRSWRRRLHEWDEPNVALNIRAAYTKNNKDLRESGLVNDNGEVVMFTRSETSNQINFAEGKTTPQSTQSSTSGAQSRNQPYFSSAPDLSRYSP